MSTPAPAPAPTRAPLPMSKNHPRHFRLQEEDAQPELGQEDIVLGPFKVKSEHEVDALRREIGLDRDSIKRGDAGHNAKLWLSKQGKRRQLEKRQNAAEQECFVGNNQLSCYPTAGLRVNQGTWSRFIWNTNYPLFTNNGGYVDVYLFHQDTDKIYTTWTSLPNDQGRLSFSPSDSWWEGRVAANNFNGTDIAWPFYFVITYAGQGLTGSTTRLSTWYAVQTALPRSIAASLSSASLASAANSAATLTGSAASALQASDAAASSSLAASLTSVLLSSLEAEGFTGTETLQGTATATLSDGHTITATATAQANGRLPNLPLDESGLPRYAIALIVVFGFLALVAVIVGLYFILAAARRRREREFGSDENESKTESRTPMMGEQPYSDEPMSSVEVDEMPPPVLTGAREDSTDENNKQDAPFSSNDASKMAEAYRAALREPAFNQDKDEAEKLRRLTVMSQDDDSEGAGAELIREELKAEGHNLKQVGERRKPQVHD